MPLKLFLFSKLIYYLIKNKILLQHQQFHQIGEFIFREVMLKLGSPFFLEIHATIA